MQILFLQTVKISVGLKTDLDDCIKFTTLYEKPCWINDDICICFSVICMHNNYKLKLLFWKLTQIVDNVFLF